MATTFRDGLNNLAEVGALGDTAEVGQEMKQLLELGHQDDARVERIILGHEGQTNT